MMSKKKIMIIAILIIILIVITSLFFLPQKRTLGGCILPAFYLEIDVVDTNVSDNLTIHWQFRNEYSNNVNITATKYHSNFQLYILAANGTKYQYVGPMTLEVPPIVNMSYDEIWQGNYSIEFRNYTYHSGVNYTNWQNGTTNQYWFFEPGRYKIFCIYGSVYNVPASPTPIDGSWKSNTEPFYIP